MSMAYATRKLIDTLNTPTKPTVIIQFALSGAVTVMPDERR
jgi:hypothetical protein